MAASARNFAAEQEDYEIEDDEEVVEAVDSSQSCTPSLSQRRKKSMSEQYKMIVTRYESKVRRFSQDLQRKKFDEEAAMTLIFRSISGRDGRLIWGICRHLEANVDRCVMFKPLYQYEISVGAVIKVYKPWKEISIPGLPMSVIVCTDFYRLRQKYDRFWVSTEFEKQIRKEPIPFKFTYSKVLVNDQLNSLLYNLLPFKTTTENTIAKQIILFEPFVNLDVVIYQLPSTDVCNHFEPGEVLTLLSDSDKFICVLDMVEDAAKKQELLKVLKPGSYFKFTKLGVRSKIRFTEDAALFPILKKMGSSQQYFYVLGLRSDTEWEFHLHLPIPYTPIQLETTTLHSTL